MTSTCRESCTSQEVECGICNDLEFVVDEKTNTAMPCECRDIKRIKRIYEKSGISRALEGKTFESFIIDKKYPILRMAKEAAQNYAKDFDKESSFALFGQVGSGKTHLCVAISNELMKKGVPVLYMQYREVITGLKQIITDEEAYKTELNKYKNVSVLYIDDLYKGAQRAGQVNDSDLRIMFEIINFRYLNKKPVIISSELSMKHGILKIDEAIGSRILEMCRGFAIELPADLQLNHRLKGW